VQVKISARHGHLSPATQERVAEKVERLRRFFDRITAIDVTVDLEHRETPDVEVRVSAEHTDGFVATDTGELMAALDSTVRKVEQQLKKHKEKIQSGHRQAKRKQIESPVDDELDQ